MEHSVDFLLGSVKPTDKTTSHIHRLSDEIALDVLTSKTIEFVMNPRGVHHYVSVSNLRNPSSVRALLC